MPALNDAVANFVSEKVWGVPDRFEKYCTMGVFRDHRISAGVVYHNFQQEEGTVEVSCAANNRRWMTREVISAAISMPFELLNCQAVVARHEETAKHIRHIWRSLGAKEFILPRLRGKDKPDEAVAILTDDAWSASKWNIEGVK